MLKPLNCAKTAKKVLKPLKSAKIAKKCQNWKKVSKQLKIALKIAKKC